MLELQQHVLNTESKTSAEGKEIKPEMFCAWWSSVKFLDLESTQAKETNLAATQQGDSSTHGTWFASSSSSVGVPET